MFTILAAMCCAMSMMAGEEEARLDSIYFYNSAPDNLTGREVHSYDGKGNLVAKDGTKLIQTVKITNTAHKGVKTGDDSNVILYSTTMLGSILAFLFMAIRRRRNRA